MSDETIIEKLEYDNSLRIITPIEMSPSPVIGRIKRITSVDVSPSTFMKHFRKQSSVAPLYHKAFNSDRKKIVVSMVGLPARGKTYISKKMTRYFNWNGVCTKVFNVGDYRRKLDEKYTGHDFFDPNNSYAQEVRKKAAEEALSDMLYWMKLDEAELAVFDATNTTRERRAKVCAECHENGIEIIFLESVCDDPAVIRANILDVKIDSPDYINMSKEQAVEDFGQRIKHYENVYEPLSEAVDQELSFIRIFNQGRKYSINNVHGNLQSRIVYYLMNIRPINRTIYISRHGESEMNVLGKIGGNSNLSENGRKYAEKLGKYMNSLNIPNLKILTSHMKRTWQTAKHVATSNVTQWKALNEIDAGKCEELSYEEIQDMYPVEFAERDNDKYHFRYPNGESYQDLVARLEPVIMQLERDDNTLVVCHQAVARCLLAYFLDKTVEELPYIKVPLHTVLKLTPTAYRCVLEEISLDVDAVDTHRMKPDKDLFTISKDKSINN